MDVLKYILILVITCMISVPFLSFLFSWCCSIYFTRKMKFVAQVTEGLAKAVTVFSEKMEKKDDSNSDVQ